MSEARPPRKPPRVPWGWALSGWVRANLRDHESFASGQYHDTVTVGFLFTGPILHTRHSRICTRVKRRDMMASDLWSPKASDALSAPPTSADGRPIVVNYRIILFSIHDIKTREQCAGIHMALVFYWTDARMAGWHGPTLPPMLWGPDAWICGAVEPPNIDDEQFVLIDATEGRLKRIVHFRANLRMRMPNLSRFPFDLQELDAGFESISHWRVLSGWPRGSLPAGQSYILEPVELPTEGVLFTQKWDGSITGWTFRSYRTAQEQETNKDAGFTKTEIHLKLSMYRKHRYYAFKVLFPLYLLTGTAFAVQFIPISEIQDRIACTFTMFLAAFSLSTPA